MRRPKTTKVRTEGLIYCDDGLEKKGEIRRKARGWHVRCETQDEGKVHDETNELLTPPHHVTQSHTACSTLKNQKCVLCSEKVQVEWRIACFQAHHTSHPLQQQLQSDGITMIKCVFFNIHCYEQAHDRELNGSHYRT